MGQSKRPEERDGRHAQSAARQSLHRKQNSRLGEARREVGFVETSWRAAPGVVRGILYARRGGAAQLHSGLSRAQSIWVSSIGSGACGIASSVGRRDSEFNRKLDLISIV